MKATNGRQSNTVRIVCSRALVSALCSTPVFELRRGAEEFRELLQRFSVISALLTAQPKAPRCPMLTGAKVFLFRRWQLPPQNWLQCGAAGQSNKVLREPFRTPATDHDCVPQVSCISLSTDDEKWQCALFSHSAHLHDLNKKPSKPCCSLSE